MSAKTGFTTAKYDVKQTSSKNNDKNGDRCRFTAHLVMDDKGCQRNCSQFLCSINRPQLRK